MNEIAAALSRLALALWVGGAALFTFLVTPIVFRTQPRDVAGSVVGAVFPAYFRAGLLLALASLLLRFAAGEASGSARRWIGTGILAACILLLSYHAFALHPRIEAARAKVASFASVSPEDPARREFSRLHGLSMALNLAVLGGGAALVLFQEALRR